MFQLIRFLSERWSGRVEIKKLIEHIAAFYHEPLQVDDAIALLD